MVMNYPNQDAFRAYCIVKGYHEQFNDGLKFALQTDLASDLESLNDLMKLYYETNGADYLYPS
jgi:hypothetical protein